MLKDLCFKHFACNSVKTLRIRSNPGGTQHIDGPICFHCIVQCFMHDFQLCQVGKILDSRSIHLKRITLSFWLSEGGDRWGENHKAPSRYILKVKWGVSQHKRVTKLYYLGRRGVDLIDTSFNPHHPPPPPQSHYPHLPLAKFKNLYLILLANDSRILSKSLWQ